MIDLESERGRLPADFAFKPHYAPVRQGIFDCIARICAMIPAEAHLGSISATATWMGSISSSPRI